MKGYAGAGWRDDPGALTRLMTDLHAFADTLGPDAFDNAVHIARARMGEVAA